MDSKINTKQKQDEVKSLDNAELIEVYKLRCCSGRTAPMGIDEDSNYFYNDQYIKIIANEMKKRNLQDNLIKWDL